MSLQEVTGLKQQTPEWLAWRKTGIGGSDAPAIMGCSPWSNPLDVWNEKTGKDTVVKDNYAIRNGNKNEPIARRKLEERLGVQLNPICLQDEIGGYQWLCSLDGATADLDIVVELKCPLKKHRPLREVPAHYVPQVQHQLMGIKPRMFVFAEYFAREDILEHIEVHSDSNYITVLKQKEGDFWKMVVEGRKPDFSDEIVNMNNDDSLTELIGRLFAVRNQLDLYGGIKEDIEEKIKKTAKDAGHKKILAGGALINLINKVGNVDYEKLIKDNCPGVVKEQYRKPGTSYHKITRYGEKD
jgi:putative phage-type endonuclease